MRGIRRVARRYPCVLGRVDDEDDDVGALDDEADAVDGEDEGAVGVDDGEPVKEPEQAVHERRQVGVRLELLHVLGLADMPERRPAYAQAENERQIHALATTFHPCEYIAERRRKGLTQGRGRAQRR